MAKEKSKNRTKKLQDIDKKINEIKECIKKVKKHEKNEKWKLIISKDRSWQVWKRQTEIIENNCKK